MKELQHNLNKDLSEILSTSINNIEIKIYENSSSVQYTLEEFFNHYNPEEIQKGQCNLVFKIDVTNLDRTNTVVGFQLKDMYNCCGIIVASDLHVSKVYRNRGIGKIITKFIYDFSKYYGYGILQAADKADNQYQVRIFEKFGWKSVSNFVNPKTGNTLSIWLLNLN